MDPIKEVIKNIQTLNKNEHYALVRDKLTDEFLELYENADLYAELALACNRLKDYDRAETAINKALQINPLHTEANNCRGFLLVEKKQYDDAIHCYKTVLEAMPNSEIPYRGLGRIYLAQKNFENAIEIYSKLLNINPKSVTALNGLGNAYVGLGEDEKAIENYQKALKEDPESSNINYNLGLAYYNLKQAEKAIEYYKKALENSPEDVEILSGLGSAYSALELYSLANDNFIKALELDPQDDATIYNRAVVYYKTKDYKRALLDYQKYIEITKDNPDIYTEIAASRIEELNKILSDSDYTKVSELVENVKKLLLYTEDRVTHYTSLSVTKVLILEESKFRLSEGTFLNDTSEGRELFNYLSFHATPKNGNDIIAQSFTTKPFIGSFVADNKHDDLTLWRMYGKEAKDEAKGCAITFDKNAFLKNIKQKLKSDNKINNHLNQDFEFDFYRVAYRKPDSDIFVIPGAEIMEPDLNNYMKEMYDCIQKLRSKEQVDDISTQNILELLNDIAYLFKSIEYQYEYEIRLVIKDAMFERIISQSFNPPRVYIELVPVNPVLTGITLGPKVERADEWASAFYYSLDKKFHRPNVLISHLPFK